MNGKPSSPVLRGLGASDGARLLDHVVLGKFQLSGFGVYQACGLLLICPSLVPSQHGALTRRPNFWRVYDALASGLGTHGGGRRPSLAPSEDFGGE